MTTALPFTFFFFFFNDTATTEIYTFPTRRSSDLLKPGDASRALARCRGVVPRAIPGSGWPRWSSDAQKPSRSEEHTSELQSRLHLVCRLLLAKKTQKR